MTTKPEEIEKLKAHVKTAEQELDTARTALAEAEGGDIDLAKSLIESEYSYLEKKGDSK
jgi:hypothetical protein